MENVKNPGEEEKSPQSEGQPKPIPKLLVKIPIEYLTEKQKRLLAKKTPSKEEPLTSEKKEHVFKVPEIPTPSKTRKSPSKVSSDTIAVVAQTVQDASLEDSGIDELKESPSKVSSDAEATGVQTD